MSETGSANIGGQAFTFVTYRQWNVATKTYDDLVQCFDGDVRDRLLALHNPPTLIIVNVRYDNEPERRPPDRALHNQN